MGISAFHAKKILTFVSLSYLLYFNLQGLLLD